MGLGVLLEAHVEIGGQAQADDFGAHERDVAVDDAALLQPLDAPEHGARGKADLLGDLVVGGTPVCLQRAQNEPINLVECFHGAIFAIFLRHASLWRPITLKT
ncbi:hypothetical protein D9M68_993810 [compost metagenome]